MKKIVGLSGGKDSSAMALRLMEVEPADYDFAITPTGRELPEMKAHWRRLEELLGKPLTIIPAPTLIELIVRYKALPNWRMRWCTRQVKIEPFMVYVAANKPATTYIGIRADEEGREATDWHGVEGVTQDFPFKRWKWGLANVLAYLKERGVIVPPRTDCDFCFFQRLIEWWELWKYHLDLYLEAEALEHYTKHTFRSDQRDSWPAGLRELRQCFESGRVPVDTRKSRTRTAMCSWCAR